MSNVDRRSSGRKVRLDASIKADILKDNAEGMAPEEIASKYDIHAEYVRRVVKKAISDSQSK
jgi:Mor family transcriptional regulator